jgi:hypothetical protein
MSYRVFEAKYAKDKIAVYCSDDSGYKTNEAYMIDALGGKYSNREGAYIASKKAIEDMKLLLSCGWTGSSGLYRGDRSSFSHCNYGYGFSRKEAIKMAKASLSA